MLSSKGLKKNPYKFIGVHLQYKSAIMNQLNIHDFYIFFFKPKSFLYDLYNNSKWTKSYS
jgi:type II restriction/modification system DNA methylase subunit YeeA